jgi:hypothetical protein
MAEMNQKDFAAFKYFMAAWKQNWDLNRYYRDWYDEDLEYYRGYRDEDKYPMAYNMSFNKLLPRVMTVLSRFMEQLYQAGTGDLVSVRPRKKTDVDRAPRVQGLLNYQLETLNEIDNQGGSYLFNMQWMFNALTFGKGIAKLYWRKEERISPRRINIPMPRFDDMGNLIGMENMQATVEGPQIVYDGPYAEVIHNKLFNPHPHYRSIQQMPFVGILYSKPIDYIKKMADKGVFEKKYVKNIGWSKSSGRTPSYGEDSAEAFIKSLDIEGGLEQDLFTSDQISPNVDIIEGYGRYIMPEDETPYEVGSGYKIKGKESEVIVHIANYRTILSLKKNTYGIRPLFDIGAYYHPELFWDLGLVRLGKDLQEQYNNLANTRYQNALMSVNQMLKVREDADIPPEALIWKPYGIIPVEEMTDVEPLVLPDQNQTLVFKDQEQFFEATLSDITGMYPYSMGQTPPRKENVGTIYSLQSMGEARTKLLMMTMDHMGFRPFLKYMMLLNVYNLPANMEARINSKEGVEFTPLFAGDMHVDYDFSARYTALEPALGRQFRAQQLIQYAQMWQQSPYLQHHQFMKAILELLDFHDSEKYLKTPEEVQRAQMAAAQKAAQTQMMGMAAQDRMMAKQTEREMTRDVVKGLMK